MSSSSEHDYRQKIWNLIKDAHSALLVTVGQDGRLDSRPMGCLQREFDDTLWFLTFRHSPKAKQLAKDLAGASPATTFLSFFIFLSPVIN